MIPLVVDRVSAVSRVMSEVYAAGVTHHSYQCISDIPAIGLPMEVLAQLQPF